VVGWRPNDEKCKIKNEDEDGKWGNEDSPVLAGCSAPSAPSAEQVQSSKFKVRSQADRRIAKAEFEGLRSKMGFLPKTQ
jgi:hypothetical protein